MKCIRVLRILGIAVILSLLVMAIPAMPALAYDQEITLSPSSGVVGEKIKIHGTDFSPTEITREEPRRVDIYLSADEVQPGDYVTASGFDTYKKWSASASVGYVGDSDEGEFTDTITIPAELDDGVDDEYVEAGKTYYVCATRYNVITIVAVAELTIGGGEIELFPVEGPVDTPVEITGSDFGSRDDIIVEYDGDEIARRDIEGDIETNSSGNFDSIIYIPESTAGAHNITVTVGTSEAEAEFTVKPSIDLSNQSGGPGDQLTVYGTGFDRRPAEVFIYFNNTQVAIETTNTRGSFDTTFFVPEGLSAGSYTIEAEDDDRNLASAPFTLTTTPAAEPTTPAEPPSTSARAAIQLAH